MNAVITKTITKHVWNSDFKDASGEPVELELAYTTHDSKEPIYKHKHSNGNMTVGYLANDVDCENPLTSCDGMGHIYHAHIKRQGNKNESQLYEEACETDSCAILLDIYNHGGCCYAIHNSAEARNFPDQQWDVSHGGAVWVPDTDARQSIIIQAVRKHGIEVETLQTACYSQDANNCRPWIIKIGEEQFSNWKDATDYARSLAANKNEVEYIKAEREVSIEFAKQAIDEYNKWLVGDCYGVVVERFNTNGVQIDDDTCWGYIGEEYAKTELKNLFEYHVNRI